jgi:hypothetical protein
LISLPKSDIRHPISERRSHGREESRTLSASLLSAGADAFYAVYANITRMAAHPIHHHQFEDPEADDEGASRT